MGAFYYPPILYHPANLDQELSIQTEMTDIFSKQKRSQIMSRIRSKGSVPEMLVRRVIHRFRLHVKNLPEKPDLVLKRHKLIVLVHGCFWHRHQERKISKIPKSNTAFWVTKFEGNVTRDLKNQKTLREMGWRVETIGCGRIYPSTI